MLNESRRRVTTCPGMGQIVTPGASCKCMIDHWDALNVLYTCIVIMQGYYGTFRRDFSILKT